MRYWYFAIDLKTEDLTWVLSVKEEKVDELLKTIVTDTEEENKPGRYFNYFENFLMGDSDDYLIYEQAKGDRVNNFGTFVLNSKSDNPKLAFLDIETHPSYVEKDYGEHFDKFRKIISTYFDNNEYLTSHLKNTVSGVENLFEDSKGLKPAVLIGDKMLRLFDSLIDWSVLLDNADQIQLVSLDQMNVSDRMMVLNKTSKNKNVTFDIHVEARRISRQILNKFKMSFLSEFTSTNPDVNIYKAIEFFVLVALVEAPVITTNYQDSVFRILKMVNPHYSEKNYIPLYGDLTSKDSVIFDLSKDYDSASTLNAAVSKNVSGRRDLKGHYVVAYGFDYKNDNIFNAIIKYLKPNEIYWLNIFNSTFLGTSLRPKYNSIDSVKDYNQRNPKIKMISLNKFAGKTKYNKGLLKLNQTIFLIAIDKMLMHYKFSTMSEDKQKNSYIDNILVISNHIENKDPQTLTTLYRDSIKNSNLWYWKAFFAKFFPDLVINYEGKMIWKENFLEHHDDLSEKIINPLLINIYPQVFIENIDILKEILRTESSWERYGDHFWTKLFLNKLFTQKYYETLIANDGDTHHAVLRNIMLIISQITDKDLDSLKKAKPWLIVNSFKHFNELINKPLFNEKSLLKILNNSNKWNFNAAEVANVNKTKPRSIKDLRWVYLTLVLRQALIEVEPKSLSVINLEMLKMLAIHFKRDEEAASAMTNILIRYLDGGVRRPNKDTLDSLMALDLENEIINEYAKQVEYSTMELEVVSGLIQDIYKIKDFRSMSKWFQAYNESYDKNPISTIKTIEDNLLKPGRDRIWNMLISSTQTNKKSKRLQRKTERKIISYFEKNPSLAFMFLFVNSDRKDNELSAMELKVIDLMSKNSSSRKNNKKREEFIAELPKIISNLSEESVRLMSYSMAKITDLKKLNYSGEIFTVYYTLLDMVINKSGDFRDADAIIRGTVNRRKVDSATEDDSKVPTSKSIARTTRNLILNKGVSEKYVKNIMNLEKNTSHNTYIITSIIDKPDKFDLILNTAKTKEDRQSIQNLIQVAHNISLNRFALTNSHLGEDSILIFSWFDRIEKIWAGIDFKTIDINVINFDLDHIIEIDLKKGEDNFNRIYQSLMMNRFIFSDYVFLNGNNPISYGTLLEWLTKHSLTTVHNGFEVSSVMDMKLLQTILLYKWVKYLYPDNISKEEYSIKSLLEHLYFDSDAVFGLFEYIEKNIDDKKVILTNKKPSNPDFVREGDIASVIKAAKSGRVIDTIKVKKAVPGKFTRETVDFGKDEDDQMAIALKKIEESRSTFKPLESTKKKVGVGNDFNTFEEVAVGDFSHEEKWDKEDEDGE